MSIFFLFSLFPSPLSLSGNKNQKQDKNVIINLKNNIFINITYCLNERNITYVTQIFKQVSISRYQVPENASNFFIYFIIYV